MTTTMTKERGDEIDQVPVRLDFEQHAAAFARAVNHLDQAAIKELDRAGIDPGLRELIRVRASQLNGCAYCVDMHTVDARAIGETEQRLYALPVWDETPFFTPPERAALRFTEAVTRISVGRLSDDDYDAVAQYYTPDEVAALLSLIIVINTWNTIGAATHAWRPGSYSV